MGEDGYHQAHGHRYAWDHMLRSDEGQNAEHSEMRSKNLHQILLKY